MRKPVQARSLVTIEKVLDAAESLVARQGIGSLTMDAVAAEAEISKGGILHHFRSKDALVEALTARKLKTLRDGLARQTTGTTGARTLAGLVRHGVEQYPEEHGFPRTLLVAAVENSASLAEFRALFADTLRDVEAEADGRDLDPVLFFAVMGLLLTKSLGIGDLPADKAGRLFAAILAMAGPTPVGDDPPRNDPPPPRLTSRDDP